MQTLAGLFGESPFEHLVEHAHKVHECVALLRPVAEAIIAGDLPHLQQLQEQVARTEFEADQVKDHIRAKLPSRLFLPVNREDIINFVRQMDRIGDDVEDFSVIATFRKLDLPAEFHADFLALVEKVVQVSETMLKLAEELALLEKESFGGPAAENMLEKITVVCRMEWESDRLSQNFARRYYSTPNLDPVTIMLLDKLCRSLTSIADHAENVGKNLRLMITRQ